MFDKTKQQQKMMEMASNDKWDLFVTLSFTTIKTQDQVTKSLKLFFISVERTCFGRQATNKLIHRLPVIEHTSEATHIHLLIIKPYDKKFSEFRDVLMTKWKKVSGSGWSNLRKKDGGSTWYMAITDTNEDRENVINYITKHIPHDYKTVDFENVMTTSI